MVRSSVRRSKTASRNPISHPSRRGQEAAPQDEVRTYRSFPRAATERADAAAHHHHFVHHVDDDADVVGHDPTTSPTLGRVLLRVRSRSMFSAKRAILAQDVEDQAVAEVAGPCLRAAQNARQAGGSSRFE